MRRWLFFTPNRLLVDGARPSKRVSVLYFPNSEATPIPVNAGKKAGSLAGHA